ncbi:MAG: ABC transporter ATP-binding protein [Gammaproteobacteria bacterium]|nr:ABC transporter ATP-binding protein [Gammaproteobacteria bacterium]
MHAIQTFELTKRYGSRPAKSVLAVDRISFAVEQGQVFGFLGPNGSGKTTTIGMLVGTIKPTDGSFNLFGASGPKALMSVRARVGATLETPNFYPYMSGRDNLRVAAAVKGVDRPRIGECLELVGLSDRANHRFKTYSLGMKQRLALAATMLSDPELIILDEPANGLDPQGIREIREIIGILADRGKTIFLSSHLLAEVERTCSHVAIIRKGRIVTWGAVADVVGEGSAVLLRADDTKALAGAMEAYPGASSVRRTDDGLVATLDSGDLASVTRYLAGQGIYLSHLAPYRPSLEEVFIDVTQGAVDSMTEMAS